MNPIKVLIVDDSAFMRKVIKDLISEDKRIQVVGSARNGLDAIDKIKELSPDVVTLDVEMPVMDGLDALKRIMNEFPRPVIMLSSTTTEGAKNTIQAIAYGAFDFVSKPSGAISLDLYKVKEVLIEKILSATHANITQLTKLQKEDQPVINHVNKQMPLPASHHLRGGPAKKLVLIGTSTGGPRALEKVLTKLPKSMDAPIVIVQHMPSGFTKSLAERLDGLSQIHIKEAVDGEILQNGVAYIAPGGFHLNIKLIGKSLVSQLNKLPAIRGHRPSVDSLFTSASDLNDYKKIVVIMTGMGSDGTDGLKQIKQTKMENRVYAIAESENTAVIFGMPKSAIKTGYIDEVLDVDKIANKLVNLVNEG